MCRLTLESGEQHTVTLNHPVWSARKTCRNGRTPRITDAGYHAASDLRPGDVVARAIETPVFGNKPLPAGEPEILGYMIGDGGMTGLTPTFTQMPGAQLDEFLELTGALGCDVHYSPSGSKAKQMRVVGRNGENKLTDILRRHGLMGKHSRDKFVPDAIFTAPREQIAAFLNRLYTTDGWASTPPQIGFCSVSERLCRDVQYLLQRLGIRGRLRYRQNVNAWCVEIEQAKQCILFAERVGIKGKESAIDKVVSECRSQTRFDKWRDYNAPTGFRWERIKSIENLDPTDTVAICVPGPECYVTDILEHNSFLAGVLASHSYDCWNPGCVIISAPNERQITNAVFKELRNLRHFDSNFAPKKNELFGAHNHWIKGFTARDDTAFQGNHDQHVFGIYDEAEGMAAPFWVAGEYQFDWWVCFYNPTEISSPAAMAEDSGLWEIHRISALNHPNIAAELAGQPKVIPNAVGLREVKNRLARDATKLLDSDPPHPNEITLDGQRYALGPVAQARILGVRPTGGANCVFSENLWKQMLAVACEPESHWPVAIGADIARYGEDFSVFVVRKGKSILHIEQHNGWSVPQIAARLKELVIKNVSKAAEAERVPVLIDDTGVGGGVTDLAGEYRFIGVNFQYKAEDEEMYPNSRSELWFRFADLVRADAIDISRIDTDTKRDLRAQLLSPLYTLDRKGRRLLEEKKHTRARIGVSPDIADALVLATYTSPEFFESYTSLK